MNKKYIVEFDFGRHYGGIPTEIRAENGELALNQAKEKAIEEIKRI